MTVEVCTRNENLEEDMVLFHNALSRDGELLGERFARLAELMAELGYRPAPPKGGVSDAG